MSSPGPATARRRKFSVDALFSDTTPRAVGVTDLLDAKLIQLDRIEPDPDQPRREFDPDALEELAASIRAEGVLQPIAVRYDTARDVYVVVHGERRWRASRLAGLSQIPAIVRDVPEDRRLIQQLMENVVREDLNALDRAAALRALKARMDDAPWERVAEAVGIRRSRLFQLLGTEKLAPPVQEALRRGVVSEKQTRAVQTLPRDVQADLGDQLLDGSLHPRDLEDTVREIRQPARGGGAASRSGSSTARIATARRQIRALSGSLATLPATTDDIASDALEALVDELHALRDQIEQVVAVLEP